jgi:hypothetical protein
MYSSLDRNIDEILIKNRSLNMWKRRTDQVVILLLVAGYS